MNKALGSTTHIAHDQVRKKERGTVDVGKNRSGPWGR